MNRLLYFDIYNCYCKSFQQYFNILLPFFFFLKIHADRITEEELKLLIAKAIEDAKAAAKEEVAIAVAQYAHRRGSRNNSKKERNVNEVTHINGDSNIH